MTAPILRYFAYDHLPARLRPISQVFADLAYHLAKTLPPGSETTVALRKVLEAKDAAVRAALDAPEAPDA
jgi:hypothetical protein